VIRAHPVARIDLRCRPQKTIANTNSAGWYGRVSGELVQITISVSISVPTSVG
jgi:hypothetical protein